MLSRRSVRIKIMQVLYGAVISEQTPNPEILEKLYRNKVQQTYQLYLYCLLQMQKVVLYTEHDAAFREGRHIKSDADRSFDGRILHNPVAQSLIHNADLNQALVSHNIRYRSSDEFTKRFYYNFIKIDSVVELLNKDRETLTNDDFTQILLALFKHLCADEVFADLAETAFVHWEEDKSFAISAVKRSIKKLTETETFIQEFVPDEETVTEFGSELLYKIAFFHDDLSKTINDKLENWDADRVNAIDRILLTMTLAELLYCPTIPVRVSLDEYIELAKMYSTDKSKEFVNGIADQLVRDLTENGKLHKIGRGLNT